ncbi:HAMP domain-containing histidine kinase [Candidatus Persebacteraceae bacterium Df01]|uniref:histidine kinase n=1 Tax=Candidatus Doriopsillibacter californiensis TaxID=2970740 RepID=A0ABT7QLM6_9GAMM|nr:HAMP domain-containing histidine kinase [Candidatus Persebacteraceae bacterium Df01]
MKAGWRSSLIVKITWMAIVASLLTIVIIIIFMSFLFEQTNRRHHGYYARTVRAVAMRVYENPTPFSINHITHETGLGLRYSGPFFDHVSDVDMPGFGEVLFLKRSRGVVLAQGNERLVALHTKGPHKLMINLDDYRSPWEVAAGSVVFLVLVLSLLWGLFYFYQRRLLMPLQVLRNDMEAVGRGEWRQTVIGRNDEIGDLATGFNQMQEKLRVLVQAKLRFLADASHELRSPLARLRLAAEFVQDDNLRARMCTDVMELDRLTGDIMEKTRLDNFRQRLKKTRLQLTDVFSNLQEKYPAVIFRVTVDTTIEADVEVLLRALSNLLDNAVKFASDNVWADGTAADGGALISIRDDGPGANEEDLPNLFEPFYRADTSRSRKTGGFGLGLSIVKATVEAHNGKITAKNASSGGLIMELWLPEKNDESQQNIVDETTVSNES